MYPGATGDGTQPHAQKRDLYRGHRTPVQKPHKLIPNLDLLLHRGAMIPTCAITRPFGVQAVKGEYRTGGRLSSLETADSSTGEAGAGGTHDFVCHSHEVFDLAYLHSRGKEMQTTPIDPVRNVPAPQEKTIRCPKHTNTLFECFTCMTASTAGIFFERTSLSPYTKLHFNL